MKIVMVAGMLVAAVCYGQTAQRERGFSVLDSIEMNTFSEPTALDPKAVAPTSPNRKYFVVVTSRGNLKSDKVESTLYLFSRADGERFVRDEKVGAEPPQPLRLVTIAAIPSVNSYLPYSPVISDITWAPDSSAVYFLADQGDSRRRLCSVEVHSRSLHCLTPDSYDVERYRVSRGTIVYTATHAANGSGEDDFQSDSGAIPIRGMSITRILFPGSSLKPRIHELWYLRRGHLHRVRQHSKSSELDLLHYWDVLSISPGERYIVQIKPVAAVKPAWEAYVPEIGKEDWKIDSGNRREASPSNIFRARQYVLVDLLTGESCPLIDAPYADVLGYIESFQAVWSSDEKRLLLTNTFLPLEGSPERESRLRPCAVASVDLPSKQVHCVAFTRSSGERAKHSPNALTLDDASFGATGDEAALRLHDEAGGILREIYRFDGHAWSLIESRNQGENDKETSRSTALYIKQNLNDPPVLCARTASGGTKQIWNPNPQFSSIRFSTASVYHWVDDTGFKWTGGLVMPLDYVPGRRYPLVIQTHGFADFAFIT
jgi:dipeptidyl aminopeptidase/acylaminoacyl peptidase